MTKISSTMLSVGTLLRHAEDSGARVSVLVQGTWLEGRVIGCDGLGAVVDDGSAQFLVRLDSVVAVKFQRDQVEPDDSGARAHGSREAGPFATGPITVPSSRSEQPIQMLQGLSAKPY